jgi:hypothetical protein
VSLEGDHFPMASWMFNGLVPVTDE